MATFTYSGRTRAGQTVTGERVADTMDAAVSALRRDQICKVIHSPLRNGLGALTPVAAGHSALEEYETPCRAWRRNQ